MKIVRKPLSELKRPEKNVRLHTDRQLKELVRSVEMFGQIRPIVIDEQGVMLAGNGLYEALLKMGRAEADCYVAAGLTDKQKKKLMLADNKVYALGADDMEAFDAILAELDGDCDIPGFDEELIQTLMADVAEVDDILTGYGVFDDSARANMQAGAARTAQAAPREGTVRADTTPPPPSAAPVAIPQQGPVAPYSEPRGDDSAPEATEAPYATCPQCGTRFLLGGDAPCR